MKRIFGWFLVALMAVPGGLSARTATGGSGGQRIYDGREFKGNNFCMWLTNYGMFGHNPQTDNSGAWWPCSRPLETYIFGAGIWVGAKKGSDTLVDFGYNPSSGESELVPAHWHGDSLDYVLASSDPYDRVHIYGVTTTEGYDWPLKASDGTDSVVSFTDAVMRFVDLDPASQEPGSAPIGLFFQEYAYTWTIAGLDNIVFLGYQIQNVSGDTLDSVYVAFTYDDDLGNESNGNDLVGFVRYYTFPNDTAPTLLNLAYQYQTDPEPGWLGPKGDGIPGVIGSMLLKTPTADPEYGDIIIIDSIGTPVNDTVHPGEELGMTAFKIFTRQIDPNTDAERYVLMVGWNPPSAGGDWDPYMDDVYGPSDKRFMQVSGPFRMVPGETVELIGAAFVASDTASLLTTAKATLGIYKNNFQSARPPERPTLTAIPGFKKVVLYWDNVAEQSEDPFYAIAGDPASDFYNPAYRQFDFEGYRLLRSTDGETWDTLGVWDLINGFTTFYIDTFVNGAGQEVYGETLFVGTDRGLTHYYVDTNVVNGVRYFYRLEAYDLNYQSYAVDTTVNPPDTFGVRPFSLASLPAIAFGPDGKEGVIPRTPPADRQFPQTSMTTVGSGGSMLGYSSFFTIDTARAATPGTYRVVLEYFGASVSGQGADGPPDLRFSVEKQDPNTGTWNRIYAHIPFNFTDNGLSWVGISQENPLILDTLTAVVQDFQISGKTVPPSAVYYMVSPDLYVDPADSVAPSDGKWKFTAMDPIQPDTTQPPIGYGVTLKNRGAFYPTTYKLIWHVIPDPARNDTGFTLEVVDTVRNLTLPFDSSNVGLAATYSDVWGWAFYHKLRGTRKDTLWLNQDIRPFQSIPNLVDIGVLLPGGNMLKLKLFYHDGTNWQVLVPPADGESWVVSYYTRYAYDPFPVGGVQLVTETTPKATISYYLTGDTAILRYTPYQATDQYELNVGVWPNPYRGIQPLDFNKEFRTGGVHFTHLPTHATLRIFNLAGDLVKVIDVTPQDYGEVSWDLLNEYGTRIAPGIYIFHVETPDGKTFTGKFAVIL